MRQAETVVEQANANHAAQVRARAQAENALVLLLGQPLPSDLPPPVPLSSPDAACRHPGRSAVGAPDAPSGHHASRGDAARGERQHRRCARSVLSVHQPDRRSGHGELRAFRAVQARITGVELLAIHHPADLQGRPAAGEPRCRDLQKDINVAQYEKTIQTAFREVADGLAARGTYNDQVAAVERYTAAQQSALDLSVMRFRNGVDNYLSVLTAQTDLYGAQQVLVATRMARLTNLVDLYRALGGGWIEHTGDVPRPAEEVGSIASPSPSPWSLLGTGELGRTVRAN